MIRPVFLSSALYVLLGALVFGCNLPEQICLLSTDGSCGGGYTQPNGQVHFNVSYGVGGTSVSSAQGTVSTVVLSGEGWISGFPGTFVGSTGVSELEVQYTLGLPDDDCQSKMTQALEQGLQLDIYGVGSAASQTINDCPDVPAGFTGSTPCIAEIVTTVQLSFIASCQLSTVGPSPSPAPTATPMPVVVGPAGN
jgi:hypothetical protein